MSPEDNLSNLTNILNQFDDSFLTTDLLLTTTRTTEKIILKPSLVETDILKQSQAVKPPTETDESKTKPLCMKFFCCYHHNETNQNNSFSCQEKDDKQSDICTDVLTSCLISTSQICLIEKTNTRCRIDQICTDGKQPECSIPLIETAIDASRSTPTTITATDLPSTTIATTIIPATTTIATTLPTTTTPTTTPTTTSMC